MAECSPTSLSPLPFGDSFSDSAGVRCQRTTTSESLKLRCESVSACHFMLEARSDCLDGDVRLVNGTTSYEGRVEICYDGVWGSVCDSYWSYWDAAIVCLQLGFQGTSTKYLSKNFKHKTIFNFLCHHRK